jgi:flavin-dependent dehydrogenase
MHVGPRGYVGVAPLDNRGLVTVGLVRKPGRIGSPAAGLEAALADYPALSRRLAAGRPVGTVQGVGPLAHRVRVCHGPGYLLVGDAAGFFDPFTGEGIFRALRGAELAAKAIDRALRAGTPYSAGPTYARLRKHAFGAKERLTVLIQLFVQQPWLMDRVVRRLEQRPAVARELGNVLGDLQPATLGLTSRLLAP